MMMWFFSCDNQPHQSDDSAKINNNLYLKIFAQTGTDVAIGGHWRPFQYIAIVNSKKFKTPQNEAGIHRMAFVHSAITQ